MITTIAFDWDPTKATINVAKHGVEFEEASSVFLDPLTLTIYDLNSTDEERWITLGVSATGRMVVVVHTWVDMGAERASVRIISARRPTRKEARQYRDGT